MKNPTQSIFRLAMVSTLALVAACASDLSDGTGRSGVSARVDAVEGQVEEDGTALTSMTATGRPANIRVRDGLYLGHDGFRTGRGDPLPRKFQTPDAISLTNGGETNIVEVAGLIKRFTGIQVETRDLNSIPPEIARSTGDAGSAAARTVTPMVPHPLSVTFPLRYTGSLSGLLDYVASQAGVDWEYRGGKIRFLGAQTVTYTIWALPSSSQSETTIGGNSGSSDVFGGSSPATTTSKFETDYWSDVDATLASIVPETGAAFQVNRSSGTIIVTALQNVHERVMEFVERENARLSRQVAIKVDILSYARDNSDTRSTSFDLALQRAAAGLNLNLASAANEISGGMGISTTVLEKSSGALADLTGSTAIINALAEQGKVSLLNSTSVIAMNNTATPVSMLNERAYLANITRTTDPDTGETTYSTDTGIVNDGLNMVVTPRILSSGDVSISYSMNLSELKQLEEFATDDGSVVLQLPEVNNRNFMQSMTIESGETMVIASYDRSYSKRGAKGPFNARLWGLGGSDSFRAQDSRIIVLMTPVVIEKQNAPHLRRR